MSTHEGRIALITGASSGVGAQAARTLAAAGAKVVLAARRIDRLTVLADDIAAAGGTALPIAMDVSDEASIATAFATAQAALGPVDTIIANAGINWQGRALEIPAAEFDAIFMVNVRGVFLTLREGARRMIAAGAAQRGRCVIIASIGGTKVLPGLTAYCASKAALVMMGRSLAAEWARTGISVNILCPGFMTTELTDDWFATEAGDRMVQGFRRQRLMPLEALDPMMLQLTGDAAAHTTGAVVVVDDGQSI